MSALTGPPVDSRPAELRSIADSIQPMFPSAAAHLRGIARDMEVSA